MVSARSALLSNYEVLTLLKELESDQLARTKTAIRIKKEEEQAGTGDGKANHHIVEEVSENLRTVEFEVRCTIPLIFKSGHAELLVQVGYSISLCGFPTDAFAERRVDHTACERPCAI